MYCVRASTEMTGIGFLHERFFLFLKSATQHLPEKQLNIQIVDFCAVEPKPQFIVR